MRPVAARVGTERNDDGASVRDTSNLALEDAKLGRVDQIVGQFTATSGARIASSRGPGS